MKDLVGLAAKLYFGVSQYAANSVFHSYYSVRSIKFHYDRTIEHVSLPDCRCSVKINQSSKPPPPLLGQKLPFRESTVHQAEHDGESVTISCMLSIID
jgi:hypothetical protein